MTSKKQPVVTEDGEDLPEHVAILKSLFDSIDFEGNGTINSNEFYYFLQIHNPTLSQSQAEVLFSKVDKNKSGKISWLEFYQAARQKELGFIYLLSGGNPSSILAESSSLGKVNSAISPQQVGTFSTLHQPPVASNTLDRFDVRRLTTREIRAALGLYEKLDVDRNNRVSLNEFKKAFQEVDPTYPESEINRIFLMIDINKDHDISIDEFLSGVSRGYVNPSIFTKLLGSSAKQEYEWEIDFSELTVSRHNLSSFGTYGEVYPATWRGAQVSVKFLRNHKPFPKAQKDFAKEVEQLFALRHPNCALLLGATLKTPNLVVVTESCNKGSLKKLIESQHLTSIQYANILIGISMGLNHLHIRKPKIIHGDLKPENILLDDNLRPKISDFGLLSSLELKSSAHGLYGTPPYMAPEVWMGKQCDEKIDVFAFAVLMFEFTFRELIRSYNHERSGTIGGYRRALPENVDPIIRSVITRCWAPEARLRPSMESVAVELGKLLERIPRS